MAEYKYPENIRLLVKMAARRPKDWELELRKNFDNYRDALGGGDNAQLLFMLFNENAANRQSLEKTGEINKFTKQAIEKHSMAALAGRVKGAVELAEPGGQDADILSVGRVLAVDYMLLKVFTPMLGQTREACEILAAKGYPSAQKLAAKANTGHDEAKALGYYEAMMANPVASPTAVEVAEARIKEIKGSQAKGKREKISEAKDEPQNPSASSLPQRLKTAFAH
ncbi:hypothetical protein FACS1894186_2970 [Alphaproteobacteria bacterium]|nr:hypothetical protein FACS1894186_2970 [Alphaproteobacteria bacterium]